MDLQTYLSDRRTRTEAFLEKILPPAATRPSLLHEAMRYSVLNGGKRIRPILCIATAEVLGENPDASLPAAAAVELFHCSTLVHDDLPCMDDDDLRRGLPTCHIKFGEANAVLTGDALILLAFEALTQSPHAAQLCKELAKAGGSTGVIAGQVEDLAAEGGVASPELIDYIHRKKTAELIRAAVRMGALSSGADASQLDLLTRFAENIGLAFQIVDDILDETSTDATLGKPVGSDLERNKMTYPSTHGMEAAQQKVVELTDRGLSSLRAVQGDTTALHNIANYLLDRKY